MDKKVPRDHPLSSKAFFYLPLTPMTNSKHYTGPDKIKTCECKIVITFIYTSISTYLGCSKEVR